MRTTPQRIPIRGPRTTSRPPIGPQDRSRPSRPASAAGQHPANVVHRTESYLDPVGASTAPASRVIEGAGGYRYEQYADGTIVIRSGPGVTAPVKLTSGRAFQAVTREIGPYPTPPTSAAGSAGTTTENVQEGGAWLDWLARQADALGEAASDLFDTAGEWASEVADDWFSEDAPREDVPVTPGDRSPEAETEKVASMTGTPLELALEKVGAVDYVDPKFGVGAGKREFEKSEVRALKSGADDIDVASCSPFAYWTLAASGIDINVEIEGDGVSIREYINLEGGAMKGGSYKDLIDASDDRIKGAAVAFDEAGIGVEVEQAEACPGDYVQTFSTGHGGHSTIVHRAHCVGAAIFGLPGSPEAVGFAPAAGGGAPYGFSGEKVRFVLDENTRPELVGAFETEKVELLGAHLSGKNAEGESEGPGVYTKKAASLSSYYRAFVGRLNTSIWANHSPADPSAYANHESDSSAESENAGSWFPWPW